MSSEPQPRPKKLPADDRPDHPGPPPQIVKQRPAAPQQSKPNLSPTAAVNAEVVEPPTNAIRMVSPLDVLNTFLAPQAADGARSSWNYAIGALVVFAGIVCWLGFAAMQDFIPYGERFNDENAMGATANRLTKLLHAQWGMRPGEMILVGVLLWVLAALGDVRAALDRLNGRSANP